MRTNIEIDDDLLDEAMAATGLATKRAKRRCANWSIRSGARMLFVRQLGSAGRATLRQCGTTATRARDRRRYLCLDRAFPQ